MRHTPQLGGCSPNPESRQDTEKQGPQATKATRTTNKVLGSNEPRIIRSPRDEWVEYKLARWKCRSSGSPHNPKRSRALVGYLGISKSFEVVTNGGERVLQVTPSKGRRQPPFIGWGKSGRWRGQPVFTSGRPWSPARPA